MEKRNRGGCSFGLFLVLAAGLALLAISSVRLLEERQQTTAPPTTTQPPVAMPVEFARAGSYRYHYSNLDPAQQAAYDDILARIIGFPENIPVRGLDAEGLGKVFNALGLDQPLLFHISTTQYKIRKAESGELTAFLPQYRMDRGEYKRRCETLAAVCESIPLPAGGGEFDIELALHDHLVRSCAYSDADSDEKGTAYGALVNRSASCEGYARAMLLLLELNGVDACIVTGQASNTAGFSGGHAWNKVRVAGDWYYLDATWDDPVTESSDRGNISHAYFNLSAAELSASHEITDTREPCTATSQNYFRRKGLYYGKIDRAAEPALAQALAQTLDTGDNVLEIRMETAQALKNAVNYLIQKQRVCRVLSSADPGGRRIKTDTVFHSEMEQLRVIRILPVLK